MANKPLDPNSLKPNSHAYKESVAQNREGVSKEKMAPVVHREGVVATKRSFGQKLADLFISEDAKDVKSYVLMDVVVPTIKNTLLDILEMFLFGERSNRSRYASRRDDRDRVVYSSYYKSDYDSRRDRERSGYYSNNSKVDYRNIVLKDRRDAEMIVQKMKERIAEYRQASVADLLDLIDVTSNYVDNNWGWTDERDIGIRRVSAGYLIDVSEARYLDY